MIRNRSFWEEESDAPLLRKNNEFISQSVVEEPIRRAENWLESLETYCKEPYKTASKVEWTKTCLNKECQRIFELDAERTFQNAENRLVLTEALCTIYNNINDYHQGMSFITAFLLLFLPKEQVVYMIIQLHKFYVPGYFKAASIAYFRDAKVFEKLLAQKHSDLHKHITLYVPSEAYCSKWFVGFNIHVLPFPAVADFLDAFLEQGDLFNFKYALALTKTLTPKLMITKDASKILSYLRLDGSEFNFNKSSATNNTPGSFFTDIIEDGKNVDLFQSEIEHLRKEAMNDLMEEQRLRDLREQQLKELDEEDDSIIFSSDEEDISNNKH